MNIQHALKQLKQEYRATGPSELLREHGWSALLSRIEEEERGWAMRRAWMLLASVLVLVILGGAGTVYAAQSAKPGDVLYPVKVASDRVAAQIAPILNRPEVEHKEEVDHTEVTPRPTDRVEQLKESIDGVTKDKDNKKENEKEERKDDKEVPTRDVEIPRDVPVAIPSAVPTTPPALEVVPPVIPPIPSVGL